MHLTEGWVMFVAAFAILGGVTWVLARGEGWIRHVRQPAGAA